MQYCNRYLVHMNYTHAVMMTRSRNCLITAIPLVIFLIVMAITLPQFPYNLFRGTIWWCMASYWVCFSIEQFLQWILNHDSLEMILLNSYYNERPLNRLHLLVSPSYLVNKDKIYSCGKKNSQQEKKCRSYALPYFIQVDQFHLALYTLLWKQNLCMHVI